MVLSVALGSFVCFVVLIKLVYSCLVEPFLCYKKLRSHGFTGPTPSFPFGNRSQMMNANMDPQQDQINHDIHPICMPYFSVWQKAHEKIFVYWVGTQPFLYVADPLFLQQISEAVPTRNWGKPLVFKGDRQSLFGEFGLNMIEAQGWLLQKLIIGPAFSSSSLKLITNSMAECTKKLMDRWMMLTTSSSNVVIDVDNEISSIAAEMISKIIFGLNYDQGKLIYNKLRAMQFVLFKNMYNRYIGVPFGQLLCPKETLEATRLGKDIDRFLQSIITSRRKVDIGVESREDHLGLMLQGDEPKSAKRMTDREVIDECKSFFFAGYESGTLAISWTLLFLSLNQTWQEELRKEIKEVVGDGEITLTTLARLKKMGWVMSEAVRLYPSSPSCLPRVRDDIKVGETIIPKETNL